jgi:hypothetical protein
VLAAEHRSFLVAHGSGREASTRHYAYAWGLAHYLTFERLVLGTAALDEFVDPRASSLPARERFERLVGQPLNQFEPQWRQYILSLKPAPAAP